MLTKQFFGLTELVKFEQNRMIRTTQNFKLFDKNSFTM